MKSEPGRSSISSDQERLPSGLPTAVEWVRSIASRVLKPGSIAIDATTGKGLDTLWLTRLVQPGGRVYGFDIQSEAVRITRLRLRDNDAESGVVLFEMGHERMLEALPSTLAGTVGVVMFNLGYLPGGPKHVATLPSSTIQALDISTGLLAPGGMLTVVAYRGHPGGAEEADAVVQWASGLPPLHFHVARYHMLNTNTPAPEVCAIERRREEGNVPQP